MGVLMQGTSAGVRGTLRTVQVIDTSFAGTATDISLGGNGFLLAYKPEEERPDVEIVTSELTFNIMRTSAVASVVDTFITNLLGADEGRFQVVVLNADDSLYWCGYIIADQVMYEDTRWADTISAYAVRAKDGINRLKAIDYNDDGTAYEGRVTFKDHLFNILGKLGLDSYWGSTDFYLTSYVRWYEEKDATATLDVNEMDRTYFDHFAVLKYDKQGNYIYPSTYDVLKSICAIWGARFYFADGRYRFEQWGEWRNTGTLRQHNYYKNATKPSTTSSVDIEVDETDGDFITLAGSRIELLAPVREIRVGFKHRNDRNYIEGEQWDGSVNVVRVGFVGGSDIRFRIAGSISTKATINPDIIQPTPVGAPIFSVVGIRIVFTFDGTDYRLKRKANIANGNINYDLAEWSTIVSDDYEVVMPIQGGDFDVSTTVDFLTPTFPGSSPAFVDMQVLYARTANQAGIGVLTSSTSLSFTNSVFQLFSTNNEALAIETIFLRQNTVAPNASEILEKDVLVADSPTFLTSASITIKVAGEDVPTGKWTKGLTGTGVTIQARLANELLEQRKLALRVLDGVIIDRDNTVGYGNVLKLTTAEQYFALQTTYNAAAEEWNGKWVSIGYSDTLTAIEPTATTPPLGPGTVLPPTGNGPSNIATGITPIEAPGLFDDGGHVVGTTGGVLVDDDVITSIPIAPIGADGVILDGDTIALLDPNSGNTQYFTVAADVTGIATSISITSITVDGDFGDNSYVVIGTGALVDNIREGSAGGGTGIRYVQLFTGTGATKTVTVNSGNLPSNTDLIDVYYNGQNLTEGSDYTVGGSNIILTFAPPSSAKVVVKFLVFDGDVSTANRFVQLFTGGTATKTITENGGTLPANNDLIDVYYNGQCLIETSDYTVSGSNVVLTFTPASTAKTVVKFLIFA